VSVHLSVIIPAHNEERRLPATLERVLDHLGAQAFTWDVWVVDSGSTDRTAAIANQFAQRHPQLHLVKESRPGKGLAVRRGMLAASGDYRFICDADLSMPIEQVNRFLPPQLNGVDVAIGSREAEGAVRYDEPLHRHMIGRVFNNLVRIMAVPGIQDTQCGF
jgi:dolichyl-phosphate beta-glucosyltransferase